MNQQEKEKTWLIWVDCEMTGLNVFTDRLLEIALVITQGENDRIFYENSWIIRTEESVLNQMDQWNHTHHKKSGLWEEALASPYTVVDVEKEIMEAMHHLAIPAKAAFLCGNSIHQDRVFLKRFLGAFESFLHYRQLDISSLKILWPLWMPRVPSFSKKSENHRALQDAKESLGEYLYYKNAIIGTR